MLVSLSVLATGAGFDITAHPHPKVRHCVPCMGDVNTKLVVNEPDCRSFIFVTFSQFPEQLSLSKRFVRVAISDTYLCVFQFLAVFEDGDFFITIIQS